MHPSFLPTMPVPITAGIKPENRPNWMEQHAPLERTFPLGSLYCYYRAKNSKKSQEATLYLL
jgi:hypothetical protein